MELIKEIQQYADGESIYIPKKEGTVKYRRQNTNTKTVLNRRDIEIYQKYLNGCRKVDLSQEYHISTRESIKYYQNKIVDKENSMEDMKEMRGNWIIKCMDEKHKQESLNFVEKVFTVSDGEKEGKLVRNLVEEIRSKKFYLPELELIMLDEKDSVIGYAMFSRFHLEGKYDKQLLLLSPVAVKTELQRQHISKELIEYGFEKAKKSGYEAVLVEGNPRNYNPRGFKTSCHYGITASEKIKLPAPECLMVKELQEGALESIKGMVDYSYYESLT